VGRAGPQTQFEDRVNSHLTTSWRLHRHMADRGRDLTTSGRPKCRLFPRSVEPIAGRSLALVPVSAVSPPRRIVVRLPERVRRLMPANGSQNMSTSQRMRGGRRHEHP
jgi:hypothetical protein